MAWSAAMAATVAVGIGVAVARAERERRDARERARKRERRFGLRSDETAAHGLQRIALGQLDLASELLRSASSTPPEEAVHETRKALKRLRALMRLLEGEIGTKRAERERAILRDAGRRLAGARDAEVMVDTLEQLMRRHPRKLRRRREVVELREHLRREHRAASAQALGDTETRAEVAAELCAVRARVTRWKLHDRPAKRLAEPGLEHIYRAGQHRHRRAAKRKPARRAMHKWRKQVKDLRYALEIADVSDTQGGRTDPRNTGKDRPGKRSNGRIARLARRADRLGELLGEEHDLMMLAELVEAHKPLKRRRRSRKRLLRAIARRRARLRERALHEGGRLYERKPKRFVRRVRP
jgi:hypothetical protein